MGTEYTQVWGLDDLTPRFYNVTKGARASAELIAARPADPMADRPLHDLLAPGDVLLVTRTGEPIAVKSCGSRVFAAERGGDLGIRCGINEGDELLFVGTVA